MRLDVNLGTRIVKALEKGQPLTTKMNTSATRNITKFKMDNPYILESLPNKILDNKQVFDDMFLLQGKDIKKVEKFLNNVGNDNNTLSQALSKLRNIFYKKQKSFSDEEINSLIKKAFPHTKIPTDVNCDAFVYLSSLPKETGCRFDAHGMGKISITQQLKDLNTIIEKGLKKNLCTAPLVAKNDKIGAGLGTAGGHAYYDGSFILVGEKDKMLQDSGIKHVIVNDAYYKIIDDLQAKFKDINFVRADNAVEYFKNI